MRVVKYLCEKLSGLMKGVAEAIQTSSEVHCQESCGH